MSFLRRLFGRQQEPPRSRRQSDTYDDAPQQGYEKATPDTWINNRYEVVGPPLMGGMGVVYICNDLQEDRPVALKAIRPQYSLDRDARDRFLREAAAWVDLGAHPNIVRCFSVENAYADGKPMVYLVLELIAKEQGYPDASLRSWLTPGCPLPLATALLFVLQIARGMRYAVNAIPGFVHRDLKPENVLVGMDRLPGWGVNRVRVTDFGLATVCRAISRRGVGSTTQHQVSGNEAPMSDAHLTDNAVGTPLYMAPEQWLDEPVGVYTDVYAFGCLLYEGIAGKPAVSGKSIQALQRQHCAGLISPLPPSVPATAREAVRRCLALDAGTRFQSWDDVVGAAESVYEEVTGRAPPPESIPMSPDQLETIAVGWSRNVIGLAYTELGRADLALGHFTRSADLAHAERELFLEGVALGNAGDAHYFLGRLHEATEYYRKSLEICQTIGDRLHQAWVTALLGRVLVTQGHADEAIELYEWSLSVYSELGHRRGESQVLGNLGSAHMSLKLSEQAIEYFTQALGISVELGDQQGIASEFGNLAIAYDVQGQTERAMGFHERSLSISRRIGDLRGEAVSLGNIGAHYQELGKMKQAIDYCLQALIIDRQIGYRKGELVELRGLASAYFASEQTEKAVEFHERAVVLARDLGFRDVEGSELDALGMALVRLDRWGEAAVAHSKSLEIARELADRRAEALRLAHLGRAYIVLGNQDVGIDLQKQAVSMLNELGETKLALLFQLSIQSHQERKTRTVEIDASNQPDVDLGLGSNHTVLIVGRLRRDPELRNAQNGTPVRVFPVAVRQEEIDTDGLCRERWTWFWVTAGHELAREAVMNLRKGHEVLVEGCFQPESATGCPRIWIGQDGMPESAYEIMAEKIVVLSEG